MNSEPISSLNKVFRRVKQSLNELTFLFFITALFVVVPAAYAHEISPTGALEVIVDDTFEISVTGDCVVIASVSVDNPTVIGGANEKMEVSPVFQMTALTSGFAKITISFEGQGVPPSCTDTGSATLDVTVMDASQGSTSSNNLLSGTAGEPINTFTGELFNSFRPDIHLGGPMALAYSRYYASDLKSDNVSGRMGDNWRHRFEWTLSNTGTAIDIVNHQGRLIQFTQSGAVWDLTGKTDIVFQLVLTS